MTTRRQRGDGSLYQQSDGLWCATIDLGIGGDGKRRRRKIRSKDYATAVRKLRELRRHVQDGTLATTGSSTVAAWLTRWLDEIARQRIKPKTLAGYRSIITGQLVPEIGAYRLDKLTPAHVRQMHRSLEKRGLAASSVLKTHRVLAKALTDAQREGLVHRNVSTLVDAPSKNDSDRGALTVKQAVALLRAAEAAADPLTSRWAAALLLGARQGELLGLTWDRVDLEAGTVDLAWQLQQLPQLHGCDGRCGYQRAAYCPERRFDAPRGFELHPLRGSLALTRPKSRAGRRLIPLPAPLAAVLLRHQQNAPANAYGLVWTTDGHPWAPRRDHLAWKAALERAGLPDVPLHAARHSTATILLEAGVDAHVIASILGHSSIVVSRGYQHVDLTLQRSAMAGLDKLLALD